MAAAAFGGRCVESRALLAFVLSVVILVGYQVLFAPEPPPQEAPPEAVESSSTAEQSSATGDELAAASAPALPAVVPEPAPTLAREIPEQLLTVESDLYRVTFSSVGGRVKSFELKEYAKDGETGGANGEALDMVAAGRLAPLGLYWMKGDQVSGDLDVSYQMEADARTISGQQEATVRLVGTGPAGESIDKTLRLKADSYVLDYRARIAQDAADHIGVSWSRYVHEGRGRFAGTEGPVALVGEDLEASNAASLKEPVSYQGDIHWAGYADHYFLAAYLPVESGGDLRFIGAAASGLGEATLWSPVQDSGVHYRLFVGPKKLALLKSLGHGLDQAVNFGWFAVVARPLLDLLIFLYSFTGNYGWSIILLTVGIRVVFYPINKRQAEAMKAMQRIQPELKKLQEKYKDDREQLNKEMMELYRRHKVNPLSGCLPMLLQLPVFLGLYNGLMQAIELRHAPFVGWVTDLSQPDRLGSLAIPFVSPPGIPVLTLLMGVSMVVQQRMTPASGDPMQQRMMMFLPVVFTVMFVNFPSGLVLYWFANNVMSIAQQMATNRAKS